MKIPSLQNLKTSTFSSHFESARLHGDFIARNLITDSLEERKDDRSCQCSKVLVIDDNEFNIFAVQLILEQISDEVQEMDYRIID